MLFKSNIWPPKQALKLLVRMLTSSNHASFQYEIVEPTYSISYPKRTFPGDILRPDYAKHGYPSKHSNKEYVKNIDDITRISRSCKIAKTILMDTGKQLKVQIDRIVWTALIVNLIRLALILVWHDMRRH